MRLSFVILLILLTIVPVAAQQSTAVIAVFHIKDEKVTPVSTEIVYGGSPNYFQERGEFLVASSNVDGLHQREVWIEDPRVFRILDVVEGEPSRVIGDDIDFTVILPYNIDTEKVSLYDKNRQLLAEADLADAKHTFCTANPSDVRCGKTIVTGSKKTPGFAGFTGVCGVLVLMMLYRKRRGDDKDTDLAS